MQAFSELRQAARVRRDKLIDKARSEYEDTLRQIANLEQDLLGREKRGHKSIASCVENIIPNDGPFTSGDVLRALESLDPLRGQCRFLLGKVR